MPDDEFTSLNLVARDVEDLSVVSAVVQDAIVPVRDIAYLEADRAFVFALNRFRWERQDIGTAGSGAGERVHAGLRFDTVTGVAFRSIDHANRDVFLSILSVTYDEGRAVIHFSGGGAIRLTVDELHCTIRDFDEPWPTIWRPDHANA